MGLSEFHDILSLIILHFGGDILLMEAVLVRCLIAVTIFS
jgi:hypothetical protein